MASPILQPTFTGGELSPALYARVDLARYGTSLRKAKNFIVRAYGGVVNRPGFGFVGEVKDSTKRVRLLPFEFSTEVAYVMEVGDQYIRFIYHGEYVLATTSDAWSAVASYGLGELVTDAGIVYRSLQGVNLNHTPASSPTWWEPNPVAEVEIPWTEDQLREVAITQSADVVYMTHVSHQPIEVRRITANTFEVRDFQNKNGPFQAINADEAKLVAASGELGIISITSNTAIFTADMVGALFFIEQKDLRGIRPWEPNWRDVAVGDLCISDGKTYKATAVPSSGGMAWIQTGGVRPIHDEGRAYDGPQDQRSSGTDNYKVGVEWEYQHSGFGVALITAFVSSTNVTAQVTSRIPASCIGGLGAPGTTWTLSGDGATTAFPIAGAVSSSSLDYTVTISGAPVQSNPYYGGGGGGAACVVVEAWVLRRAGETSEFCRAGDVRVGDRLLLVSGHWGLVTRSTASPAECVKVSSLTGSISCSTTAPLGREDGMQVAAPDSKGIALVTSSGPQEVVSITPLGERLVQNITCENDFFWAGDEQWHLFSHHNAKNPGTEGEP